MTDETRPPELPNLKPSAARFRATFVAVEIVDREELKFDDLKSAVLEQTLAEEVLDWPKLARENSLIGPAPPGQPFPVDWCCASKHMWFAASQMSASVATIYVGGRVDANSVGPEKSVASWTIEHLDNIVRRYRKKRRYWFRRVTWDAEVYVNWQPSSIRTVNPPGFWQTLRSLETAPQLIPIITAGILPPLLKKIADPQQILAPQVSSVAVTSPPDQPTSNTTAQRVESWAPLIIAIGLWVFITYLTYAKGKRKRIWSVVGWDRVPGSSR